MKNSILKFSQLFEGLELDDELIQDLTQDLKDELDLDFELKKGYFSENSTSYMILNDKPTSNDDKLAYLIYIRYDQLNFSKIDCGDHKYPNHSGFTLFKDDRLFELFHQLRLISKRCKTYTQIGEKYIRFVILSDEQIELKEDPGLYKLFTEIRDKFIEIKSDFGYNTIVKFEDNKIIIKSDEMFYTDRKLNLALRGLEILPKFKMTKRIEKGERHHFGEVFNIIEKK